MGVSIENRCRWCGSKPHASVLGPRHILAKRADAEPWPSEDCPMNFTVAAPRGHFGSRRDFPSVFLGGVRETFGSKLVLFPKALISLRCLKCCK